MNQFLLNVKHLYQSTNIYIYISLYTIFKFNNQQIETYEIIKVVKSVVFHNKAFCFSNSECKKEMWTQCY